MSHIIGSNILCVSIKLLTVQSIYCWGMLICTKCSLIFLPSRSRQRTDSLTIQLSTRESAILWTSFKSKPGLSLWLPPCRLNTTLLPFGSLPVTSSPSYRPYINQYWVNHLYHDKPWEVHNRISLGSLIIKEMYSFLILSKTSIIQLTIIPSLM